MKHQLGILIFAAIALLAMQGVRAQGLGGGGGIGASNGDWELRVGPVFSESKKIDFQGGSTANIDSATGVKLGIGYYMLPELAFGLDFNWAHTKFNGTVQGNPGFSLENGHADFGTLMFNATYTLLDGPIKPLVEGGFGWNWIDTNIASGPPQAGCWWDPWWGYICSGYQPTHSNSSFAGQIGAGVQFNFSRQFAINADYRYTFIKLRNADGATGIGGIGLVFLWRFTGGD